MKKLMFSLFFTTLAIAAPAQTLSEFANKTDWIQLKELDPSCETVLRNLTKSNVNAKTATLSYKSEASVSTSKSQAELALLKLRWEWSAPWREENGGIQRSFVVKQEPKSTFVVSLIPTAETYVVNVCVTSITKP